jgi:hypothetical protein
VEALGHGDYVARYDARMKRLLLVAMACVACKEKSAPVRVYEPPPPGWPGSAAGSDTVAVAKPTAASHADWIKPAKPVAWQKPARERNPSEEVLYGTWVARVGEYGTKSAFMADRVVFQVNAKPGQDNISAITDALMNDSRIAGANCIWLELNADFTGIRRECMIVNGEPSALDQNDVMTGQKKDLGTRLEWYFDSAKPPALKIHFAEDMVVPALRDGKLRSLVYRDWWLHMGKSVGENKFEITESFPEHDYELPTKYAYEVFPQKFLGN